ncbi:hypothetical protein [Candidatus Regiella insecticola]
MAKPGCIPFVFEIAARRPGRPTDEHIPNEFQVTARRQSIESQECTDST